MILKYILLVSCAFRQSNKEKRHMKKVLIPTKLDKIASELLVASQSYTVVQDDTTEILTLAK